LTEIRELLALHYRNTFFHILPKAISLSIPDGKEGHIKEKGEED